MKIGLGKVFIKYKDRLNWWSINLIDALIKQKIWYSTYVEGLMQCPMEILAVKSSQLFFMIFKWTKNKEQLSV